MPDLFLKNKKFIFWLLTLFIISGILILSQKEKVVQAGASDNVSGFAWSENIGWISLNCTNLSSCATSNYGVNIDPSAGDFSGYAWSENIGWIRFDPNGPYPSAPNYSACLDLTGPGQTCDSLSGSNVAGGWARACSGAVDEVGCAETFSVASVPGTDFSGIDDNPLTADADFLYIVGQKSGLWRIEKRSKKNGELVSNFGTGGVITGVSGAANGVAVDDNYLYIIGTSGSDWRVERRNKITGALDWLQAGRITDTENGIAGPGYGKEIAVDGTSVYVLGSENGIQGWRLEKRDKATGFPDSSFENDGAIVFDFSGFPQALTIDGNFIYIGGYDREGGVNKWRVEKRSKVDGSLDLGFDADGVVTSAPGGDPYLIDIITDGAYVYSTGRALSGGDYVIRVEKRNKGNGALVLAFDGDGVVESNPSPYSDYGFGIEVDVNNIYIIGVQNHSQGASINRKWRIEKRNKDNGQLVAGFGDNGVIVIDFNSSLTVPEWGLAIVIDSAHIYLAGYDGTQWRIEKRDIVNGGLNWAGSTAYPDSSPLAAVFTSNSQAGGWDGWIKLRKESPPPVYGVDFNPITEEFSEWAWGGDVVGWIRFKGSTYGVIAAINVPPKKPIDNGISWDHCSARGKSTPTFNWTYNDDDGDPQAAYEIEVDDNSSFNAPKFNHLVNFASIAYVLDLSQDDDPPDPGGDWISELAWGTQYFWQVRVQDNVGNWSDWSSPPPAQFKPPKHAYPWVNPSFTWLPAEPTQKETVEFDPLDSQDFDGDAIAPAYLWTITAGAGTFVDGTTAASQYPLIQFTTRNNSVSLQLTDSDNFSCTKEIDITVQLPLPEYKEIPPVIWLKKIFAGISTLWNWI